MAPAPAPEQGFQNFSAPISAPELANFAGSGSAPALLQTKICLVINFCVPKKMFGSLQNQKN